MTFPGMWRPAIGGRFKGFGEPCEVIIPRGSHSQDIYSNQSSSFKVSIVKIEIISTSVVV